MPNSGEACALRNPTSSAKPISSFRQRRQAAQARAGVRGNMASVIFRFHRDRRRPRSQERVVAEIKWNSTCPSLCGRPLRFDLSLAFTALTFVARLLFATGPDPRRLGGFAGHDAAHRLDLTDHGRETEAGDLRFHLCGVLVSFRIARRRKSLGCCRR